MPKRVMSRHSNKMFFSHSSEKHCRGKYLCFNKCLVTKSFLDRRGGKGAREYSDVLSNVFD